MERDGVLTEEMILSKARVSDAEEVSQINYFAQSLHDVSALSRLRNVQVISLSSNHVTSLEPFAYCCALQELYLRKNNVSDLAQLVWLEGLQELVTLWLADNPCARDPLYRPFALNILLQLTTLDDEPVSRSERAEAASVTSPEMARLWQGAQLLRSAHSPRRRSSEAQALSRSQGRRRARSEDGRSSALRIEVSDAPVRLPPPPASPQASNVLTAVLALLRELSPAELDVVRDRAESLAGESSSRRF